QSCRDGLKPDIALYVGGMGSAQNNFYNRLAATYGFEAAASRIQELYLAGRRKDAAGEVPDALVDEIALVGDTDRMADQMTAWQEAGVNTLICSCDRLETIRAVAQAAERAGQF